LGKVGHGVCIEDKASASGNTFAKSPLSPSVTIKAAAE
jgi:hypothetical protein